MRPIFNTLWAKEASFFWFFFSCCVSAKKKKKKKKKNPTLSRSSPPLAGRLNSSVRFIIKAHISLKHLKHRCEDGDWVGLAAVLLPCRSGEIQFVHHDIQHVLSVRHHHGIYPRPAPEDEQENRTANKGKECYHGACSSLSPSSVVNLWVRPHTSCS